MSEQTLELRREQTTWLWGEECPGRRSSERCGPGAGAGDRQEGTGPVSVSHAVFTVTPPRNFNTTGTLPVCLLVHFPCVHSEKSSVFYTAPPPEQIPGCGFAPGENV